MEDHGEVQIRMNINKKTGKQRMEIIDHRGEASCEDGKDDDFLLNFSSYSLAGMKARLEAMQMGETAEWQAEKRRNAIQDKAQDMQGQPQEPESDDMEDEGIPNTFRSDKSLDTGFDV